MRSWRISVKDASQVLVKILHQVPVVGLHSVQTAKISALMGKLMDFTPDKVMKLYLLGALHDVGLMIPKIRREYEKFDKEKGILELVKHEDLMASHGPVGARIVESIPLLEKLSLAIEHHHTPAFELEIGEIYILANLINVSNMISLKLLENDNMADDNFRRSFEEFLKENKSEFFPDVREAALEAINREAHMMLAADSEDHWDDFVEVDGNLDMSSFMNFLALMDYLVDSMTEETEHHSTRVAFLSRELAKEILTDAEGTGIYLAGRMHDLGKIYLPGDVVRSRDDDDYNFRLHVVYTHKLFSDFSSLPNVVSWAVTHHERLDGSGYPWHLDERSLSMPARIVQVADEYVSLLEKGEKDPIGAIVSQTEAGKFDPGVVKILRGLVQNGYNVMEYYDMVDVYIKEVEMSDRGS